MASWEKEIMEFIYPTSTQEGSANTLGLVISIQKLSCPLEWFWGALLSLRIPVPEHLLLGAYSVLASSSSAGAESVRAFNHAPDSEEDTQVKPQAKFAAVGWPKCCLAEPFSLRLSFGSLEMMLVHSLLGGKSRATFWGLGLGTFLPHSCENWEEPFACAACNLSQTSSSPSPCRSVAQTKYAL